MIIRVFRGCVKAEKLQSLDGLLTEVTSRLKKQPGLVCHYLGRPMAPHATEFLVLTVWNDLQALKNFSGDNWQESVIPPLMAPVLEDSFLHHYSAFKSKP